LSWTRERGRDIPPEALNSGVPPNKKKKENVGGGKRKRTFTWGRAGVKRQLTMQSRKKTFRQSGIWEGRMKARYVGYRRRGGGEQQNQKQRGRSARCSRKWKTVKRNRPGQGSKKEAFFGPGKRVNANSSGYRSSGNREVPVKNRRKEAKSQKRGSGVHESRCE